MLYSHAFHFFNYGTKNKSIVQGSGSPMDILAQIFCPKTYEYSIINDKEF